MRQVSEALWWLAAPLGLFAFWCGMVAAAHGYPGGYDWRYRTISVLLYSDRNPHGYFWAWVGLELCGLFGIAWTADRRRGFEGATVGAGSSMRDLRLLRAGFVCMCCAVLPDRLLPVPKGHENLGYPCIRCHLYKRDAGVFLGSARPRDLQAPGHRGTPRGVTLGRRAAGALGARGDNTGLPGARTTERAVGQSVLADTPHSALLKLCCLGVGQLRDALRLPPTTLAFPHE